MLPGLPPHAPRVGLLTGSDQWLSGANTSSVSSGGGLPGFLLDQVGRACQAIELVVPSLPVDTGALEGLPQGVGNAWWDERFLRQAQALAGLDGAGVWVTGLETGLTRPWFLRVDDQGGAPAELVEPTTIDGQALVICRDDPLLTAAGLPAYTSSWHRYYTPENTPDNASADGAGGESAGLPGAGAWFVPATPGAPVNESCRVAQEAIADWDRLKPLNPLGLGVLVRRHDPWSLEAHWGLIDGQDLPATVYRPAAHETHAGVSEALTSGALDASSLNDAEDVGAWRETGRLFLNRRGATDRLAESLHLKLLAWRGAVDTVQQHAQATGTPHLGLDADAFSVWVPPVAPGAPVLWQTQVRLVRPPQAEAMTLPGTRARIVTRVGVGASGGAAPVYRPNLGDSAPLGQVNARLASVTDTQDGQVIEAYLSGPNLPTSATANSDLIGLRLPVGASALLAYGQVAASATPGDSSAQGVTTSTGLIWRSLPMGLSESDGTALQQAIGVPIPGVQASVLQSCSALDDLYALGVLGVRALLTGPERGLADALEAFTRFVRKAAETAARDAAVAGAGDAPLTHAQRLDRLARGMSSAALDEPMWAEACGPHWITGHAPGSQDGVSDASSLEEPSEAWQEASHRAFAVVPDALWWPVLACLASAFPRVSDVCPWSPLADSQQGQAGTGAAPSPERALDHLITGLNQLLRQSRSLLLMDYQYNREARSVILPMLAGLDEG